MKKKAVYFGLLILLSSWIFDRKFPDFVYTTTEGKTISNDYFIDSTTIVVHFHLGCPPSMFLLKDLQLLKEENVRVLLITENTNDQLLEFNSEEPNSWSDMRKKYGIKKMAFDIIGECTEEKVVEIDGNLIIGQQCRKLGKKLRTKYSPTIFKVNSEGKITGRFAGYSLKSNPENLKKLLEQL